jgi:hypothetical protein
MMQEMYHSTAKSLSFIVMKNYMVKCNVQITISKHVKVGLYVYLFILSATSSAGLSKIQGGENKAFAW